MQSGEELWSWIENDFAVLLAMGLNSLVQVELESLKQSWSASVSCLDSDLADHRRSFVVGRPLLLFR